MQTPMISVRGFKVSQPVDPKAIPADIVPPDGQPAGNPTIGLRLEGSSMDVRVVLNGKSLRKALKVVAEHGPDNVNLVVQGVLRPCNVGGWPFELECAGIAATIKTPKPGVPVVQAL